MRVLWTSRRSHQSILKEINPEYSLEGLMLNLKLQYFWLPDAKNWLIGKSLVLGKIEGSRRRGQQMMRRLNGINDSMDMSLSKFWVCDGQESLACCSPWVCKESDTNEQLN